MILCLVILIQYRSVTDTHTDTQTHTSQTDRDTTTAYTSLSIASRSKNQQIVILYSRLINFHKIFHSDASWTTAFQLVVKFLEFQNQRWQMATIFKKLKNAIPLQQFD